MKDGESTYTYNINQVIPDEWAQFYYGSVALTGMLPKNTTLTGFKVLDEISNDVTQYFTNKSTGQNFKATVNADYLQHASFYGHRYTIQLNMSVPQTDSVQQLSFNMATTIDGDTKASNTATTTVDKKHYLITHYYIQGTTTSIAPDQRRRVIYGTSYTTSVQTLDNYRLVGQVRTSGTFTDENQPAIYEYAPLIVSIPVKYVDQRGKEISPATSLTGRLDTGYDANNLKRTLTGYDFTSVDNVMGTYADNPAAIIFHYQAKTITIKIRDIDNYDNDLDKELGLNRTIQGLYNDPYQLSVLDVPQWSEIYSGAKSLLSGTYSENRTITLRYTQAWNQDYQGNDGSETIPVFNGLDKLIGVMQIHPNVYEENTTVLVKPNGKYLVGTLNEDIDISTFQQQASVRRGKSVVITTNTGEKVRVSISKFGEITIAHLNSKTLPVADRAVVSVDGNQVGQYVDTKSAVKGLSTSTYSLDSEYGFRQTIQKWPNGYTTLYDSSNPRKIRIVIRNGKGKVIYRQTSSKLTKAVMIETKNARWYFKSDAYGALTSSVSIINESGNGKAYVQRISILGTLKSTTKAILKQGRIVSMRTLNYGQYREQEYDDEPVSSASNSGKVIGTQTITWLKNDEVQVARYGQNGKVIGKTVYHLRQGLDFSLDFVILTTGQQNDWLSAHSTFSNHLNSNGDGTLPRHINRTSDQKQARSDNKLSSKVYTLPQTGNHSELVFSLLGMLGLLWGWINFVDKMWGEKRHE